MKKNTVNVRDLVNKYQANCDRISEIADACEKEQRERTEAETAEYNALLRENQLLQMKMQAVAVERLRENPNTVEEANRIIRENVAAGRPTQIMLVRDLVMVADTTAGGIVPVKVQDILDPLVEGLILDKVGLPMPTGLAGDYIWPTYETVEATIQGEGVALTDTEISMSKLTASPQRIGIAIPVTRQAINQTEGVVEMIVKKLMPLSVTMLLNKIMFSTTKVTSATTLVGPFVALAGSPVEVSAEPTFKEFNSLKAKVLATGVDGEHLCWVMTKAQKAIAEATPKRRRQRHHGVRERPHSRLARVHHQLHRRGLHRPGRLALPAHGPVWRHIVHHRPVQPGAQGRCGLRAQRELRYYHAAPRGFCTGKGYGRGRNN